MKIIEGKSPAERNKIIAATVLGALALLAVGYNVIGLFPAKKSSVARQTSPAPAQASQGGNAERLEMPSREAADFEYESTEIFYTPGAYGAPPASRNIFAFYEPPPPTPYVAPTPVVVIPTPTPVPPMQIVSVMPQSVYAGSKSFRLEVNGAKFTPQSRIYFNGSEMPTTFVNDRRLTSEVPSNFIAAEGMRMIRVRTSDGALYSNDFGMNVMAAPKPNFTYLGPLVRKRSNNDTAYIQEQGSQVAVGRRLNDIIGGRFRLISISATKVIVEDVNLGFRHSVNITSAAMQPGTNNPAPGPAIQNNFVPYNPNVPNPQIPNIPTPMNPNQQNRPQQPPPADDDDQDDTDGEVVDN